MDPRWLTIIGLILDLLGAAVLLTSAIMSKDRALEIGLPRWAGETEAENLKLPQVRDRILQSRAAKLGLALLLFGFILQLLGSWPR